MRRKRMLQFCLVGLCLFTLIVFTGAVIASSTVLELEAADDTDTDVSTVSYTFTTGSNATSASVSPASESKDGGSVTFEFEEWEEVGGINSGTSTSFNVDGDTTYRITYTVEADSTANEGQYNVDSTVNIENDDGSSDSHFETLSATVTLLEPEFGEIEDEEVDAAFRPEDGSTLERVVRVPLENTGDGFMDVDSIEFTGEPTHVTASVDEIPNRIDAASEEEAAIRVEVDDQISEGTHSFTATATDSLGNEESFDIEVEVVKPPAAGVSEETVDLGEILIGDSESTEFTLTERGERESISGIETRVISQPTGGSLSFPGLDSISINPGGSADQTAEISVDEDAEQGEVLEWIVFFAPDDPDGIETEEAVTFTAEVIYPPYYDDLSMTDSEFVFDEPRDETVEFVEEGSAEITNGGDLPMEIEDISASVPDNPDIDASVSNIPDSISAQSSETVTVDVGADPDSVEGEWDLVLEVSADEPQPVPDEQTGVASTDAEVSVEHEVELQIDDTHLNSGQVIITERAVELTTLSERLGYQPIDEFSMEQVSGPDQGWLTVTEQPELTDAGAEGEFAVEIEFDTSADLYQTYTWEFEASGTNVETEIITVEAIAEPVDFGATIDELETIGTDADSTLEDVAVEMAGTLEDLEELLQQGEEDAEADDITVLVTAGSSSILLLDAVQEAQTLIENEEHESAQEDLVRAVSAFNTLSLAADDVSNVELQSQIADVRNDAESVVQETIDKQQEYFQEQLADEQMPMLEEAQIQRELALLADLSGDDQRAEELREEAELAFSTYSDLISDGNDALISARELQDELDDDLFMTPANQRLFWIGSLSTYNTESEELFDTYETAIEQFEQAGAVERAETAAEEREQLQDSYQSAYLISLGLGVFFGLILIGVIGWEIRALSRYRVDSEIAVSGDFLLPWAETE